MQLKLIFDKRTNCLLHIYEDYTQASEVMRDLGLSGREVRAETWQTSDKEKALEPKSEGRWAYEDEMLRRYNTKR